MTNAFLAVRPPTAAARIILVSSRAAEIAKAGQSVYCAPRAQRSGFEAVAPETATDPRLQLVSVRTPAMDTGMQEDIRSAVALPDRDQFIPRYQGGGLTIADDVASMIITDHLAF